MDGKILIRIVTTLAAISGMAGTSDSATYLSKPAYGLTATPLGEDLHLTQDSTGYTTAVTSANGANTYKFDKYPVTHELTMDDPAHYPYDPNSDRDYAALTNKYGTITFRYEPHPGSFESPVSVWGPASLPGLQSPVNDFNIQGQVVGTNGGQAAYSSQFGFLQNDFPTIPGLVFDSGLYVDDSGQIIASGTLDGNPQYFLVTQGLPTPAPEPSAMFTYLAILNVLACRLKRKTA